MLSWSEYTAANDVNDNLFIFLHKIRSYDGLCSLLQQKNVSPPSPQQVSLWTWYSEKQRLWPPVDLGPMYPPSQKLAIKEAHSISRKPRKGVGKHMWHSRHPYVRAAGPNSLNSYVTALESYPGRKKIFDIIVGIVVTNLRADDDIRIHELGCNVGYNLDYISNKLRPMGFLSISFSGNDCWDEAVAMGNEKYPYIDITEEDTSTFIDRVQATNEKIDIVFSHSHLIHVETECLNNLYPLVRCCRYSVFFEDFDISSYIHTIAREKNNNAITASIEHLNDPNSSSRCMVLGPDVHITGDACVMSMLENRGA